jgi:hypothetical protein
MFCSKIAPIMGHVLWLLSRRPLPPQCFPWAIKARRRNHHREGGRNTGGRTRQEERENRENKETEGDVRKNWATRRRKQRRGTVESPSKLQHSGSKLRRTVKKKKIPVARESKRIERIN